MGDSQGYSQDSSQTYPQGYPQTTQSQQSQQLSTQESQYLQGLQPMASSQQHSQQVQNPQPRQQPQNLGYTRQDEQNGGPKSAASTQPQSTSATASTSAPVSATETLPVSPSSVPSPPASLVSSRPQSPSESPYSWQHQSQAAPQSRFQSQPQAVSQPQLQSQPSLQPQPQLQAVSQFQSQPQATSQPQPPQPASQPQPQPASPPIARIPLRQPRLTFGGSVHAEFVKLYSLSSTWWFTGIFVGLIWVAGIFVGWMTKPNDLNAVARGENFVNLAHIVSLPMFIVVMAAIAVLSITGEYSNMSVQSALVADPRRVSYFGSKAVVVFCHAFVSTLVASLLALVSLSAFSSGHNISSNYDDYYHSWTPFVSTVGAALAVGLFSLISLGIGAICRSTAGAMVLMIFMGGMFPGSLLILAAFTQVRFFLWLSWYMPSSCLDVFLAGYTTQEVQSAAGLDVMTYNVGAPNWWQSGLLLGLWALLFMAVGTAVFRHRDVK
ncbi:ABC transporter permease subunit [Bifidobacterium sp. ESL0790]|nr:ABC transporter permease subunit [Bifidobacterium sp. ESL0790]WEV73253.1 ABC transporter permease subunit [Bifidobacterium sp. ESL0790]